MTRRWAKVGAVFALASAPVLTLADAPRVSAGEVHETTGHEQHARHTHAANRGRQNPTGEYLRTIETYSLPDMMLIGVDGQEVALESVLGGQGPLMLEFFFTSCPAICPVLSALFSRAQAALGEDLGDTRLISISIDPEHDTPERLRAYAKAFHAGKQWSFFTGELADIQRLQRAFSSWNGNKMSHEPLIFLRQPDGKAWIRLDGLMSEQALVAEVQRLYGSSEKVHGELVSETRDTERGRQRDPR